MTQSPTTPMDFFGLPYEIRLKIYSELLVHSEPIVFVANYGPSSLPLFRPKRDGFCPNLLCFNKKAHSEASPLLYSNNRFRFPDILTSTKSAQIAPFLRQIGSQASLIRHICISFPVFDDFRQNRATLHKEHVKNLELIRDTCTSINILELSLPPDCANFALRNSPVAIEALDLLDAHFKAISSLKKIIVNFQVYSEDDLSEDRIKMRDRGWTIKVTKLSKNGWTSWDDRGEFDNEEECEMYSNEQLLLAGQREKEEEEVVEESYRRRRHPY